MITHKIFAFLRRFSSDEMKRLNDFVNSPYHNRNKKLKILFNEIKKYFPNFSSPMLNKENLSKKVNPPLQQNESTLRHLFSEFLKIIEEFLLFEEIKKSSFEKQLFLLKSLSTWNEKTQFKKLETKLNRELDMNGIDGLYFYNMKKMNINQFNFNMINGNTKSPKMIEKNRICLNSYIINLINYFITEMVNASLNLFIYDSKFKINKYNNFVSNIYEGLDISKIASTIKDEDKNNFILNIYENLYNTFKNVDDTKNYYKYKSLVIKYSDKMSRDEISYHFSMLISYCIFKTVNVEGNLELNYELLKVYDFFLKKKYFIDNKTKYLSEDLFRNIFTLAFKLKKFKWSLEFIKSNSKYLHPDKKQNLIKLSSAEYYYQIGSIRKSVKDLNKAFSFLKDIKEESLF